MTSQPARAMIVDDDDDMRFLVRSVIESANDGLEVVGDVTNGHAALSMWRSEQPDVVVTDQRMPGMTGIELAALLLAESPRVPVILYSAYVDEQMSALANAAGVCKVIDKDRYRDIPDAIRACLAAS